MNGNETNVGPVISTAVLCGCEIDSTELHRMREARIVWKIGMATGGGLWFPSTHKPKLMKVAAEYCRRYGIGTHWVEERDA